MTGTKGQSQRTSSPVLRAREFIGQLPEKVTVTELLLLPNLCFALSAVYLAEVMPAALVAVV